MTGPHDPYREVGRRVGNHIAVAFAALMHAALGLTLFLPTEALLRGIVVAVWFVAAVLIWRWRDAGLRVLALPFATAVVWYALLQTVLGGPAA